MSAELDPPDVLRCQAEFSVYRPFILGGNVRERQRCDAKPEFIATESSPGPDGRRGSMSVCARCKDKMVEKMSAGFATFVKFRLKEQP